MATKTAAQKRAAEKAQKINSDVAAGGSKPTKRAAVKLDAGLLKGVQTGVTFPTRTRGHGSVNGGILTELKKLFTGATIGSTFRLNAPEGEEAQTTLSSLVRKAIDQTCGTDMGANVAVQDGFMFIELKRRKVIQRKAAASS